MSVQKRKVGAGNYDSVVEFLDNSDPSSDLTGAVVRELLVGVANKKAKPNVPPTIVSKMGRKSLDSAGVSKPSLSVSRVIQSNGRPSTSSQTTPDPGAEFKEIHQKLDILLAWVGSLKRDATSHRDEVSAPPKPLRRAATTPDFHFN